MKKTSKGRKQIIFRLTAMEAAEVYVAGDFNEWNPQKHPLKQKTDGIWEASVMLKPGRYEYKFRVDGEWRNDPASNEVCENLFGTQNNVLSVG